MLAVPAFIYLFGLGALQATTASLAVVTVSAAAGAIPRFRLGQVRVRQSLMFWGLGVIGTFAGTRLALWIPEVLILLGFALVMLGAAIAMWRTATFTKPPKVVNRAAWLLPVVAIAIGVLTGLFGVGGGFLIVPALVLVFGFPFGVAAGTSLVVVALNSLTALIFKFDTWHEIPWHLPLLVIVGGLVGSVIASTVNLGIRQSILERGFAGLLVVLSTGMVIAQFAFAG